MVDVLSAGMIPFSTVVLVIPEALKSQASTGLTLELPYVLSIIITANRVGRLTPKVLNSASNALLLDDQPKFKIFKVPILRYKDSFRAL